MIYNETKIENLTDGALNAACLYIQDQLNQTDGGDAAIFFRGIPGDEIKALLAEYIRFEMCGLVDNEFTPTAYQYIFNAPDEKLNLILDEVTTHIEYLIDMLDSDDIKDHLADSLETFLLERILKLASDDKLSIDECTINFDDLAAELIEACEKRFTR